MEEILHLSSDDEPTEYVPPSYVPPPPEEKIIEPMEKPKFPAACESVWRCLLSISTTDIGDRVERFRARFEKFSTSQLERTETHLKKIISFLRKQAMDEAGARHHEDKLRLLERILNDRLLEDLHAQANRSGSSRNAKRAASPPKSSDQKRRTTPAPEFIPPPHKPQYQQRKEFRFFPRSRNQKPPTPPKSTPPPPPKSTATPKPTSPEPKQTNCAKCQLAFDNLVAQSKLIDELRFQNDALEKKLEMKSEPNPKVIAAINLLQQYVGSG